jgi:hypothetical protein
MSVSDVRDNSEVRISPVKLGAWISILTALIGILGMTAKGYGNILDLQAGQRDAKETFAERKAWISSLDAQVAELKQDRAAIRADMATLKDDSREVRQDVKTILRALGERSR